MRRALGYCLPAPNRLRVQNCTPPECGGIRFNYIGGVAFNNRFTSERYVTNPPVQIINASGAELHNSIVVTTTGF